MSETAELNQSIVRKANQLGILTAPNQWVRVINEISVHFSVWHGWSLDRVTGMQLKEIDRLLDQELSRSGDFQVGRSFRHSDDFSFISWKTENFYLNRSQARAFELLYSESMKGTIGLHQSTLGKKLGSSNTQFRLLHIFRSSSGEMHPIWGRLIVSIEPGVYAVNIDDQEIQSLNAM